MNVEEGMRRLGDPNEWDLTLTPRTGAFPARSQRTRTMFFSLAAVAVVALAFATSIVLTSLPKPAPLGNPAPAPTSQTDPPVQPSKTPVVTPDEEPTTDDIPELVYDGSATCRNLIDPDTADAVEALGWRVISEEGTVDEYLAKVQNDPPGSFVQRFLVYGGIVCAFGPPSSGSGVKYAYGPISADEEATEREALEEDGYEVTRLHHWDLYSPPNMDPTSMDRTVAFRDGFWAYAVNHSGTEAPTTIMDEVLSNAPE